jgi:hypothetical protein
MGLCDCATSRLTRRKQGDQSISARAAGFPALFSPGRDEPKPRFRTFHPVIKPDTLCAHLKGPKTMNPKIFKQTLCALGVLLSILPLHPLILAEDATAVKDLITT